MPICSRCGNEIEFRWVKGRCIPLHFSGGCSGSARSEVYDYAGYHRSRESSCFQTKCPKCRRAVYFIRHNGGSVWIDPPLGPPWYKHPCMDDAYVATKRRRSPVVSASILSKFEEYDGLIIGVVREAEASALKRCSMIHIEAGENQTIVLLMKNNAGFLVGHLVIFDPRGKTVSWAESDNYTFQVIARLEPRPFQPSSLARVVECPECLRKVTVGEISDHLKQQHWFPQAAAWEKLPDQPQSPQGRRPNEYAAVPERICPKPLRWKDLFDELSEYSETHRCTPNRPPTPLIVAGWTFSNDKEKKQKWRETVDWAFANGCADIVERVSDRDFYEVVELSNDAVGPMGGPCYRPWDFEAKVRPSNGELAHYLEYLFAHWSNIAGSVLSAVTLPLKFTGKKARRLLVQADGTAIPPWGGWSHRSSEEAERRTFTHFRNAVNQAIAPHEVDHIEFIATSD